MWLYYVFVRTQYGDGLQVKGSADAFHKKPQYSEGKTHSQSYSRKLHTYLTSRVHLYAWKRVAHPRTCSGVNWQLEKLNSTQIEDVSRLLLSFSKLCGCSLKPYTLPESSLDGISDDKLRRAGGGSKHLSLPEVHHLPSLPPEQRRDCCLVHGSFPETSIAE